MKSPSKPLVLAIAIAAIVFAVVVYRTQFTFDWPLTFDGLNNVVQIVAVLVGGWWALTLHPDARGQHVSRSVGQCTNHPRPCRGDPGRGHWCV